MNNIVPHEVIERKIFLIRGQKVMIDSDLAELYCIENKYLKRAVNRNIERFPSDFMFQLTKEEYNLLRCQFGTLKKGEHAKFLPYVFTEQGISMLSSVLNSSMAIQVNIAIMRTFSNLRSVLSNHVELRKKIEKMEKKYDSQFQIVFEAIKQLIEVPEKKVCKIGFLRD